MADSVIFFRSFIEAIDGLAEQDQLAAYKAIARYGLDGEIPESNGAAKAVLLMAKPVLDNYANKRKAGAMGGKAKASNALANASTQIADASRGLQKEKEKDKRKNIKDRGIFIPPTVEQVREYCTEKNYQINPESFVSYYASKGWTVGKSPMKDWKQACVTWEARRKADAKAKRPQIDQHDYDFDAIERALIAAQG